MKDLFACLLLLSPVGSFAAPDELNVFYPIQALLDAELTVNVYAYNRSDTPTTVVGDFADAEGRLFLPKPWSAVIEQVRGGKVIRTIPLKPEVKGEAVEFAMKAKGVAGVLREVMAESEDKPKIRDFEVVLKELR